MQVVDFDWFERDRRAVLAVLSLKSRLRHSAKPGVNLSGWKPNDAWQSVATETLTDWKKWNVLAPLLLETAKGAQIGGDQSDDWD